MVSPGVSWPSCMPLAMRSCWFSLRSLMVGVVCATAGSIRPASTAVKIKPLLCNFMWTPLAPLIDCQPVFRATSLNTGHGRMLRWIGNNNNRGTRFFRLPKSMNHRLKCRLKPALALAFEVSAFVRIYSPTSIRERGSRKSRNASPMKLNESTASITARAGKSTRCGASKR